MYRIASSASRAAYLQRLCQLLTAETPDLTPARLQVRRSRLRSFKALHKMWFLPRLWCCVLICIAVSASDEVCKAAFTACDL